MDFSSNSISSDLLKCPFRASVVHVTPSPSRTHQECKCFEPSVWRTDGRTLTECLINAPILYVWSRCEKSSSSLGNSTEKHPASLICESVTQFDYFEKVRHVSFWTERPRLDSYSYESRWWSLFWKVCPRSGSRLRQNRSVFTLGFFLWQTFNWPWICTDSEGPRSELRADLKGHQKEKLNVSPQSCFAEAAAAAAHTAVWSSIWIHVDAVKVW